LPRQQASAAANNLPGDLGSGVNDEIHYGDAGFATIGMKPFDLFR
jgi:enoyl-[acyl-carrier-protein] reductase (NADH)